MNTAEVPSYTEPNVTNFAIRCEVTNTGQRCGKERFCEEASLAAADVVDEYTDEVTKQFMDGNCKPLGQVEAIDVVMGFVCHKPRPDQPCVPQLRRTEVRPLPAIVLLGPITDSL